MNIIKTGGDIMRKRLLTLFGISVFVLGLAGCGANQSSNIQKTTENVTTQNSATNTKTDTNTNVNTKNNTTDNVGISEEKAKKIALKDAGVKESEVSHIRIKLDEDDGVQEYEVDFYAGNKEYDYDINASDGTIRSKDTEIEDDFTEEASADVAISKKEAVKKALSKVNGATESDVRIHLDRDDGKLVYEGSIIHNKMEYDFEIDANTGNIIEWESESVDHD